jgi:homoserine kinase
VTVVVSAPATTANLGSGFDCVALALDLWNELEVEPGEFAVRVEGEGADELALDLSNLAVRAFALAANPAGFRFRLVNRIPLERGLGSSAAAIAAGYTAGCFVSGKPFSPVELPDAVVELDGHADNLAAAFSGGACLTWADRGVRHVRRLAAGAPLEAVAVIPVSRGHTATLRGGLPASVAHETAALAAARAALLGVALATGDVELFVQSTADILHEPYRTAESPLFAGLKADPPCRVRAVTLSGSGPTAIAWAAAADAAGVRDELERRFEEATVTVLAAAATGVVAREVVAP